MRDAVRTLQLTLIVAALFLLPGCGNEKASGGGKSAPELPHHSSERAVGPATEAPDTTQFRQIYFVSAGSGSDGSGDGSRDRPWKTVSHALARISDAAKQSRYAIFVAQGNYGGATIELKEYVEVYGGFEFSEWTRDVSAYPTVLDGERVRRVVIGADHARLDGFVIRGGRVRGEGAGILCDGVSPIVSNNVFADNKTLAPSPWQPEYWHQTANDGGALYSANGAAPLIRNNIFAENRTEIGRGGAISCHHRSSPTIRQNVFLYNQTGLEDPMRSSDGGAISVFDHSNPRIENNLILNNSALARNDGGGIFVALWSSPTIADNVLAGNYADDDGGALFVGGQEHRYDAPLDRVPPVSEFFVRVTGNLFLGNRNSSGNSGVFRFTMQSRGEVANNVAADNGGVYFQRSEAIVVNNTFLEDLLFIETPQGMGEGVIANNILWGKVEKDTTTPLRYCNLREMYPGEGNLSAEPGFLDDGLKFQVHSATYSPESYTTELILVDARFDADQLRQRVIRSGDKLAVIHTNERAGLTVWGDVSGEDSVWIYPTYRLGKDSPCIDRADSGFAPGKDREGRDRPSGKAADIGAYEFQYSSD